MKTTTATISQNNTGKGTFQFMAPEICNHGSKYVSFASDIYSFGISVKDIVGEEKLNQSRKLNTIVEKCLVNKPENRPNASELLSEMTEIIDTVPNEIEYMSRKRKIENEQKQNEELKEQLKEKNHHIEQKEQELKKRQEEIENQKEKIKQERKQLQEKEKSIKKTQVDIKNQSFHLLNVDEFECPICFDDIDIGEGISLPCCKENYCTTCLKSGIRAYLKDGELMNCMQCRECIDSAIVEKLFQNENEIVGKYQQIETKKVIQEHISFVCKTPDCENGVDFDQCTQETKWTCGKCNTAWCVKCNIEFHEGSTCEQYQQWKRENNEADDRFEKMIEDKEICKCVCGNRFVKGEGCNTVTCRCGRKYCWICHKQ